MAGVSAGKSAKGRKINRNKKKCAIYFERGRLARNKARKAEKYAKHMAKAAARKERKGEGA